MTRLGPILVATDFSAHARHATDRAARLAHETGAPLSLLHVLPGSTLRELQQWLGAGHPSALRLREQAQQQLDERAAQLLGRHRVQARTACAEGSAPDEIRREAESLDAGLLVLGARGAGVLRRLVLGSTAERLLRRSARPVLVVRQMPHEPYRRVLVAVDFSGWTAHCVALARRVAPHAHLLLFHAFQVPFEDKLRFAGVDAATIDRYRVQARASATRQIHELAADAHLKPRDWSPCVVEGSASQRLVEQEQEQDCDLIVLGKHGQSAAEDLLLGSVTKHVLAEGVCDVVVSTARQD
jgi:nucleotide-binding universal stress UspA family protein